jgi:hypothetical protein
MGDDHRADPFSDDRVMTKENDAMTAHKGGDLAGVLREHLESASPDVLRAMVKTFADALMSADADAACGAG